MSILPPTRFKRPTLLIVGCGDIGLRVLALVRERWRVLALTSTPARAGLLRQAGARPLVGNLDQPASLMGLSRAAALADAVLHLAPPPASGRSHCDPRTRHLLHALARTGLPRLSSFIYASTTGVYGDAGGALFDETRPPAPTTARAERRVDAEAQVRAFGRRHGVRTAVLRIPGIYASNRDGGHPRERLLRATPVLREEDDVYTNHIHADDLARACVAALARALPQRVLNICDDSQLKMGEYFDLAADLCGLPRPRRISREQAQAELSPMLLSFMSESRRLHNRRMKQELRLALRYPTVREGLVSGLNEGDGPQPQRAGSTSRLSTR
jgi:nucleoside-diphosphate-sugar epimerase